MSSRPDSSEFLIIAPPDLSHVAGEEWHNVLESQNEEHEHRKTDHNTWTRITDIEHSPSANSSNSTCTIYIPR